MASPAAVVIVAKPKPTLSAAHATRCAPTIARCSSREADHTRSRLGLATGIAPTSGPMTRRMPAAVIASVMAGRGRTEQRRHRRHRASGAADPAGAAGADAADAASRAPSTRTSHDDGR